MGGFLSGIGSALSGAGDAAAEYGKQQRQLIQQMKLAAVEQIHNQLKETPLDSAKYAEGIGHINKILGSGDDQGSLIGIGKRVAGRWLHHDVVNAAQDIASRSGPLVVPGGPPPPLPPGPALPGNPAGAPQAPPSGQSTNLAPAVPVPAGEVSSNLIIPPDSANSPIGDASGYTQPSSDMNLMGQGSLSRSAQNTGPIAAQPATSGIAGGKQINASPSGATVLEAAPVTPLLPAPGVQSASPIAMMPPALPLGTTAQAALSPLEEYERGLARFNGSSSPAAQALLREHFQPEITQRAEMNRAKEMDRYDLQQRQDALKTMKMQPGYDSLPLAIRVAHEGWAHSIKTPFPVTAAGYLIPKRMTTNTPISGIAPEDRHDREGRPLPPGVQFGNIYHDLASGTSFVEPSGGPSMITIGADGRPMTEAKAPGVALTGILPGQQSTVSVQTAPGAAPITTQHKKIAPAAITPSGASALTLAPGNTGAPGSAPALPRTIKPIGDPVAAHNYDEWMKGHGQAPTGKSLDGVRLYAAQNNKPLPEDLNSAGQKTMSTLTPVISQIDGILDRLKGKSGKDLMPNYLLYKAGFKTPDDDIFTNVAFERLRSGAAALQGVGSRSWNVFSEGLAHTPNLDRLHGFLPDDIGLMVDKLTEAKKIMQEEMAAAAQFQGKSGVVRAIAPPLPAASDAAVDALIKRYHPAGKR
jgi:hypothetical protein